MIRSWAATGMTSSATAPLVIGDIRKSQTSDTDLLSIAKCVEAALVQVTFTAREIEDLLALDDPSWTLDSPREPTEQTSPRKTEGAVSRSLFMGDH